MAPNPDTLDVSVTFRIDQATADELDKIGTRLQIGRSDVLRNMVRESMPRFRRTTDLLTSDLGNAVFRALLAGDDDAQLQLREILESKKGGLPA
jgi:hypothetical protein